MLTETQHAVAERVVREEEANRKHLVVYLSGAHAYGFPSPDSDLDLKAIHVANTDDLLGLESPKPTFDRAEIIDGIEIDYTSNEIAHALSGILAGNGNFIERVLGKLVVHASPALESLRPIVTRALSKRVHRHYRGFAQNQRAQLEQEPTAKKLLYVLRTAITGTHLLRTGELETDLGALLDRYDLSDARALIERKRAGERVGLDEATIAAWRPRVEALFAGIDDALAKSDLPENPPNQDEIREWLIALRRAH